MAIGAFQSFMLSCKLMPFVTWHTSRSRRRWRKLIGNPSIVEINVAIICSSMPSFAAIFKHHCGKSHFFSSMLTRLRLWGRSREFKSNSWGLQKTAKSNQNTKGGMHRDGPGLPEVPSGEMSRIRTFIWKNNRSAGDSTVEQFTLDEEHPMKPNHRTCVNDRMELSNNQVSLQDSMSCFL